MGNNRIVTVQAYDTDKQIINGAIIRNIVDINNGSNSCKVNQASTPIGNVFMKLDSLGKDISVINPTAIQTFFSGNTISWALIDTDQIASDYMSNSNALTDKTVADYKKTAGTVSVSSVGLSDSYSLQISDPSSSVLTLSSSSTSGTIANAAPGTWKVRVLSGTKVLASETIKVVSDETTSVTVTESSGSDLSDKTIIFVKAE